MSTLPEEQQNLNLRDLDDNSTSTGMIIIIVDVVAVAVFIISVFIVVFRMVSRRGKRPAYHPILPVQHTFVEATNMETLQNHTVEQVVSANDEGTLSKQKPSLETTQLPPPEQGPPSVTSLAPPTPPPSPTIPNPHSPTTPSEVHLPSHFALPSPETYGDPYPSSTRDIFRRSGGARSSATSTSRRPSISSFVTNKTAKAISKLARFSESTYPDEPALSDSWSNVLGRETSRASSATIRSSNKSKHRSSQTQAGSVKGRYWESDDVPEVPPLVFKGGDLQLNFSRGIL
ncbi:hypothetical protein B0H34DRAFT_396400 [Crassisporium funariophilum]|nr:hypothetical protein B0H34DRAFT_396400 [Crassisporium funariophilum]